MTVGIMVVFCGLSAILTRKKHKVTFLLSYFCLTKSTKSQQGGLAPSSFRTTMRRARVSRASHAWRVRATRDKSKVAVLPLSTVSAIPRVRTYHTKKPSRFVHALSARPLKKSGGREFNMRADGIESVFFILSVCYALGFAW